MDQVAALEGLAGSLFEIVADPVCIGTLYEFLGEYCHTFRNRLNSLKLSLYLARHSVAAPGDDVWLDLEKKYRQVEQLLEQLQAICRPMRLARMRFPLGAVLEERYPTWSAWLAERGRALELIRPEGSAEGCFDPTRLAQGLDSVAAWRSRAGAPGTPVVLRWWAQDDHLHLHWDEPGDGQNAGAPDQPVCLALPLIGRVVAAHGGTLAVEEQDGLQLRLRWPCDACSTLIDNQPSMT